MEDDMKMGAQPAMPEGDEEEKEKDGEQGEGDETMPKQDEGGEKPDQTKTW